MIKFKASYNDDNPNPYAYVDVLKVVAVSPQLDNYSAIHMEGGASILVFGTTAEIWETIRLEQFKHARVE